MQINKRKERQIVEMPENSTINMRNDLEKKEWIDIGGQEIWKPIVGYEGLYEVSNLGRVKALEKLIPYRLEGYKSKRKEKINLFRQKSTW